MINALIVYAFGIGLRYSSLQYVLSVLYHDEAKPSYNSHGNPLIASRITKEIVKLVCLYSTNL
jgi:hypothetical protein